MRHAWMGLLTFYFLSAPLSLADNSGWLEAANEGQTEEAIRQLRATLGTQDDARVLYNLGTLHLKSGKLALARAELERANRIDPFQPEIQRNLAIARAELAKTIDNLNPTEHLAEKVADKVPIDELRAILGLIGILWTLVWMRAYLRGKRLKAVFTHPSSLVTGAIFALVFIVFLFERGTADERPAILIEARTLRSGPGDAYGDLGNVSPGVKLRLLDEAKVASDGTRWRLVRYQTDSLGWVQESSLFEI